MSDNFNKDEKEQEPYNPLLQFDAFTAGVDPDGLKSTSAILNIVCYIVLNCKVSVTTDNIVLALVQGRIANYFEVHDAIAKLIKRGYLTENDDKTLSMSEECKFVSEIVENDLPYSVRKKSMECVQKIIASEKIQKDNKVDIEKISDDNYKVTLHICDHDIEFMTLSLYTSSIEQAKVLEEQFLDHPGEIYQNLINYLYN